MGKNFSRAARDIHLLNLAGKISRTADIVKLLSLFAVVAVCGVDLLLSVKNK